MREFGEGLWVREGSAVPFLGIPYPTRMAVARLASGGLWVWSPIRLDEELADEVAALGAVEHLVAPNKLHHLFLGEWLGRWPEARAWAAPGLAARRPDLRFAGELGDAPPDAWAGEIEQVVFRGSFWMEEVVFFHRPSRTALVTDLIQRFDPASLRGWRLWLMRLEGLVGEEGSTPREWRASFWRRGEARRARDALLAWEPERLVLAHGACAPSGAAAVIRRGLAWLGGAA